MTPAEIRQERRRLGLTQGQLAAALGVHRVTVAAWEAGTKPPAAEPMLRLALEALEARQPPGGSQGGGHDVEQ